MNRNVKAVVLCASVIGAVVCAVLAFSETGYAGSEKTDIQEQVCYVLRDYEGNVAVFVENNPDCPMTVTDIQVDTLRQVDQAALETGMKVRSQEKLMMLLEDLGS